MAKNLLEEYYMDSNILNNRTEKYSFVAAFKYQEGDNLDILYNSFSAPLPLFLFNLSKAECKNIINFQLIKVK